MQWKNLKNWIILYKMIKSNYYNWIIHLLEKLDYFVDSTIVNHLNNGSIKNFFYNEELNG